MSTTLHTFVDIFDTKIEDGENSVKLKEIVIPILDFVYGGLDETGKMTPLDGQQRLTTLYLLHWYAAKKEGVPDEKCRFLTRFTYETRYSSRDFCKSLVGFNPSFTIPLSTEIRDQAWFPLDYENDPTIRSMLVMLDAIDERFKDVPDLWDKLKQGAISFYFLPIKDMGLTDELYIKMNSRGKPLTLFEHFKAELERNLRLLEEKGGPKVADSLMGKIDGPWTDLLWTCCRGSGENIVDDEFIRLQDLVARTDNYHVKVNENDFAPDQSAYEQVWNEAAAFRSSNGFAGLLLGVSVPIHIIHGEEDPHPLVGVTAPLEQASVHYVLRTLSHCGHSPFLELEAKEEFYDVLNEMIQG